MDMMLRSIMGFLFSALTLWGVALGFTIWGSVKLYRYGKRREDTSSSKWKFLAVAAPFVVTIAFFTIYNGIVDGIQRPSGVDISAIAELTTEQVEGVPEVLVEAMRAAFGREPHVDERHGSPITSGVSGRDDHASLQVRINVHQTADNATRSIQRSRNINNREGHPFADQINDNHTEAVLVRPFMQRMSSEVPLPSPDRVAISHIRIGRVDIYMTERYRWYNGRAHLSELFINQLVETLQYTFD